MKVSKLKDLYDKAVLKLTYDDFKQVSERFIDKIIKNEILKRKVKNWLEVNFWIFVIIASPIWLVLVISLLVFYSPLFLLDKVLNKFNTSIDDESEEGNIVGIARWLVLSILFYGFWYFVISLLGN